MEAAADDDIDLTLAILYHRRKMVDRMIERLERRESHLCTERFLAPAVSSDERWAQRTPLFESVKGLIRSNFVSPN